MDAAAQQVLPFTVEQFYSAFVQYNDGVWPMQIVLCAIGVAILSLLLRGRPGESRIVSLLLAFLWVWAATAYYFMYFTPSAARAG